MRSGDEALKQLLALLSSWPESWKACPGSCLSPALIVAVLGNAFPGDCGMPLKWKTPASVLLFGLMLILSCYYLPG